LRFEEGGYWGGKKCGSGSLAYQEKTTNSKKLMGADSGTSVAANRSKGSRKGKLLGEKSVLILEGGATIEHRKKKKKKENEITRSSYADSGGGGKIGWEGEVRPPFALGKGKFL